MPHEQVDRSALAVDRIRNLDPNDPTGAAQQLRHPTDQPRVSLIEQSIEVAAPPAELDHEFRIQLESDASDLLDLAGVAGVSQDVVSLIERGRLALVSLASPMPQGSEPGTDPDVHGPRMARAASLAITYEAGSY